VTTMPADSTQSKANNNTNIGMADELKQRELCKVKRHLIQCIGSVQSE